MADPTLKDVLKAIAELRTATKADLAAVEARLDSLDAKVDSLDAKVDRVDAKVDSLDAKVDSLDAKVDRVDAKVDAHRAETKKAFEELDKELTRHASVHRESEKAIAVLEKRTAPKAARPTRTPRGR